MEKKITLQIQNQQKKGTFRIVDLAVSAEHRVKLNECEKRDKYADLAKELKKKTTLEHESDNYTNCNWYYWYSNRRIGMETGGLGNNGSGGDHSNYCIVEIGLNITQTPMKKKQSTLM